MVSRNYTPGPSLPIREKARTAWQPDGEAAVSDWRGAVGTQRISTAQPSPQLPAWTLGGGAYGVM